MKTKITKIFCMAALAVFAFTKTQAQYNTFTGTDAGKSITSGCCNTFTGYNSGYSNTTGGDNTFTGLKSGFSNTSGVCNSFVGYYSGFANTTGNYNMFSGLMSGYSNSTGSNNSFNGYKSGYYNTKGSSNSFTGGYSGWSNTTGNNNVFSGYLSGYNNTTGSNNTNLGYSATSGASYSNATAIGYNASATASNQIRIGNASVSSIGGYVSWSNVSDARFKKDIEENVPGLDFILKLRPVTYHLDMDKIASSLNTPDSLRLRESEQTKGALLQTGFIAQEVEASAQELGFDFSGVDKPKNENDFYGLRYAEFTVPLVKAVQEQQKIIEKQQSSLNQKDSAIAALNARLDRLERLMENNSSSSSTSSIQNISECCAASLEQNFPNPFNENTSIKYNINSSVQSAFVIITSIDGREIQRYSINTTGAEQITIPANSLSAGSYFYQLIVDGKQADVKKMEIVK